MRGRRKLTGTEHGLPVAFQDQLIRIMRLDGMFLVLSGVDHTNAEEADRKRELILIVSGIKSADKQSQWLNRDSPQCPSQRQLSRLLLSSAGDSMRE